jgi:GxxExxY protein
MTRIRPDEPQRPQPLVEGLITGKVIECFYRAYDGLEFGYFESVYRNALTLELGWEGLEVRAEVPIEVSYKGHVVGSYRLDLLVEGRVAVEVKATDVLPPTARRQVLNYLRASTLDVGLLLHFGPTAKFHRLVSPRLLSRERREE